VRPDVPPSEREIDKLYKERVALTTELETEQDPLKRKRLYSQLIDLNHTISGLETHQLVGGGKPNVVDRDTW
jgi:hypothetical protein